MEENQGATPEVEEVSAAEPISMDDTIRNTLRELQAKGSDVGTEDAPTEAAEKPAKARDDAGKFAAKTPTEPEPTIDPLEPEFVAPNTWRKEAAGKLANADPEIRAEVAKREADFHKGIESYKAKANYADSMERVIAPHAETLRNMGVSPDVAVSALFEADHKLRYSPPDQKLQHFAELARSYGVDLGQAANLPQPDPQAYAMQQRVQQLEGWIKQQSLMGEQQKEAALNSDISNFAADPSHSHFETVRGHMAALLQAGQAADLKDAYEQAVWANPQTRALMVAKQQTEARDKANQAAQAAKKAASVNTRARPSMPISQPIGSMDDTIRSTLRRLQNA